MPQWPKLVHADDDVFRQVLSLGWLLMSTRHCKLGSVSMNFFILKNSFAKSLKSAASILRLVRRRAPSSGVVSGNAIRMMISVGRESRVTLGCSGVSS